LRNAYIVKCERVEKDAAGNVVAVHCSYDPETKSGLPGAERKVKGVIHWVSAAHALSAPVRLYDRLISVPSPAGDDWKSDLNPDSIMVLEGCKLEPSLAGAGPEDRFQFERQGYFTVDLKESLPGRPVFNRTVTLRDSWTKK
jgi:glutaminyl-tRNA synthetase